MKIRNKLYFNAGMSIILVVILFSVMLMASRKISEKNKEREIARNLQVAISELGIITYEYLMHHEKRMEKKWNLRYNSVAKILRKEKNDETESLRSDFIDLGRLFLQIARNYKVSQNLIQIGASQEKIDSAIASDERLVSQLLITSQSIITDTSSVAEHSYAEAINIQKLSNNLIFILIVILVITVIATSLVVAKSISTPLNRLTRGAEMIGEGNLGHRIDVKSKDEIGVLASSFNNMVFKLQTADEESKEAEEALKMSEERFRNAFDFAAIGMIMADPDGRFVQVNRAMCEMTGYSAEELLARDFQSITHPDDLDEDLNHQARLLKGDIQYYRTDKRYIHRQGHEIWVHLAVSLVRNVEGHPLHFIGQIQDVTETRRARDKVLRQSAILEGINRVFREAFTCDTEEEVGSVCLDVAEKLTNSHFGLIGELNEAGLFDTTAISNPGWDACKMPDSDATASIENMEIRGIDRSAMREGKSWIVNDLSSHPDRVGTPEGHPPVTSFLGVPLKEEEKTIGMIGLGNKEGGYDQDDQASIETLSVAFVEALQDKRNELELAKYRHHLEDLVKTRTAALERSNQELEQFAYVASHDLQEPLRKVRAFGDRFMARYGDQVDEKGRDYLARVRDAGQRMATMIEDLLSLSRVTTQGKNFVPVNLMEEAQQVLSDLEVAIDECGGLFELGDLPTIEGDPQQIHQLLLNPISNAFKYRKPGVSPLVRIHAAMMESEGTEGGGLCRIHVEDNGIGFEEKYADRIFQPFQRLHGRSEYEGTGMGLAICRKIAERHDGSISARSVPGQGSTFIVTLPVTQ